MAQTSVSNAPAIAFEGMVQTGTNYPNTIVSHAASGSIYYGKAVSLYNDAEITLGEQRVKLPASGNLGRATKACGAATYAMSNGDTFVMDVDNVGDATTTFNATTATILDTTTYTGGTAATITDTTVYAVADQVGKTLTVNVIDAINGTTSTLVTFAAATTTALHVAAEIGAQVPNIKTDGSSGQVVLTTDEVGLDVSISITAGTSAITWAAPVAGGGGLVNQEGLTSIITLTGGDFTGVAQTVTFTAASGFVTELSQIVAQMGAQLDGCSVSESGGQVLITHDGFGSGMDIAAAAGTGSLTWAASTSGTGDAVDASAVTAAEVDTLITGDTTATVTVSGLIPTILSPTVGSGSELDYKSGTLLAILGLSVEVISAPAAGDLAPMNFKGVAIADPSLESTSNAYGEYVDTDSVPVMKKGRIWVVSADAVDDISKGVYIRFQNGSTAPADTLGSFRATTNADYQLMGDNVRWVAGTTIGGVEYGLLELNLDV